MQDKVLKKDLVVILISMVTLFFAFSNISSSELTIIRLIFTIPSLLFIPGYSILTNIFRIDKFGYEEGAYSLAISIAIIVLSGYVIDVLGIPLPYQLFTINACVITLASYLYSFVLNIFKGKSINK